MKKSIMRAVAPAILQQRGYETRSVSAPGTLAGSRLTANRRGNEYDFAVKVWDDRRVNFTRRLDGKWSTLECVDYVVVMVPTDDGVKEVEVLAFSARTLIRKFEQAWKALEANGSLIDDGRVSIALDEVSQKKSMHGIANIKAIALWSVELTRSQIKAANPADDFITRVRHEFADRLGLDVRKVQVEFKFDGNLSTPERFSQRLPQ